MGWQTGWVAIIWVERKPEGGVGGSNESIPGSGYRTHKTPEVQVSVSSIYRIHALH